MQGATWRVVPMLHGSASRLFGVLAAITQAREVEKEGYMVYRDGRVYLNPK